MHHCLALRVERTTFDALTPEWEDLLPRCPSDSPFLTPAWQAVWWETMAQGEGLLLLALREGDRLVGIAPLMQRGDTLSFVGEPDLFDYHDFIVPAESAPTFLEALLEHLAGLPWRRLLLTSLPEGSPTLDLLPPLAGRAGLACRVEREDTAPRLDLPSDWEAYLARLTKKDRHELRRKFRRLYGSASVHHYALTRPEEVAEAMDPFLDLMRRSAPAKAEFLTPARLRFFRRMAEAMARRGLLRLYFLEVEGVRVSTCLCLDHHGTRYLYNSGYDPSYNALSVGLLLKALAIQDAIREGLRAFDFLRGGEPYKYDLGGQDRTLYTLEVSR